MAPASAVSGQFGAISVCTRPLRLKMPDTAAKAERPAPALVLDAARPVAGPGRLHPAAHSRGVSPPRFGNGKCSNSLQKINDLRIFCLPQPVMTQNPCQVLFSGKPHILRNALHG